MILSGLAIAERATSLISPFRTKYTQFWNIWEFEPIELSGGLSIASYDIHLAENQSYSFEPGGFILASTLERFTMPADLAARVHDKSTLVRLGITVQNTFIDPGWRGFLTLELTNHSKQHYQLYGGMPIAQLVFEPVVDPGEMYFGKYQDQPNRPVEAI